MLGISLFDANPLINGLAKVKMLKEIIGYSRNRMFQLDEYIQISTL
jgi:hypothetical protein